MVPGYCAIFGAKLRSHRRSVIGERYEFGYIIQHIWCHQIVQTGSERGLCMAPRWLRGCVRLNIARLKAGSDQQAPRNASLLMRHHLYITLPRHIYITSIYPILEQHEISVRTCKDFDL